MITMNTELFRNALAQNEKPVLVEFSAPWCTYCRRIAPALAQMDAQYGEELIFGQVNIDDEPALTEAERIELVPTMVIYQNGKVLGSIVAPDSKAKLEAFILETLKK